MSIIKPAHIKKDDVIGIVAASLPVFPSFKESYKKGKNELIHMGFRLKEGKTTKLIRWWSGGTPKQQGDDINAMFRDHEVKAIISQTGGHSAISVLEHIDYDLVKNNPKPFIGMSDITVFHTALFAKSGLVGFHMDDVTYGMGWNWQKIDDKDKLYISKTYKNTLTQNKPLGQYRPLTQWECWKEGETEGILIGGNLHLFNHLYGTEYFPSLDVFNNAILFWEEEAVTLYNIARSLYQLKYWGILGRIGGMIIGKITAIKQSAQRETTDPSPKELVLDILKDYGFPILAGVDFGHYTVNLPMPVGLKARFNSRKLSLELLEAAVA